MAKKLRLFTVFNFIIITSTTIISIYDFINGAGSGQNGSNIIGWNYFIPFTVDSNMLMAIISTIALLRIFRHRNSKNTMPFSRNFSSLYLMAAVSLALTFLVVTFFLTPIRVSHGYNIFSLYVGDMLFLHLLNPILAICSFIFLFKGAEITPKGKLFSLLPPLIYAFFYGIHVLILKDWTDFYHFTFGGSYLVSIIALAVICAISYLIATVLVHFYNHYQKCAIIKHKENDNAI